MPVEIHGKEYFTVAERIQELQKNTDGQYSIETEIAKLSEGAVIFKAKLKVGNHVYTGHALERQDASFINKTSYIECAETSAIGRALASAGYGGTEFASADEVATAINNQKKSPPTNPTYPNPLKETPIPVKGVPDDKHLTLIYSKKYKNIKIMDCADKGYLNWYHDEYTKKKMITQEEQEALQERILQLVEDEQHKQDQERVIDILSNDQNELDYPDAG